MENTAGACRYLFLEPYFGGSHREFAEGLMERSRHRIDLMSMSARFWRWRMGGAALHFVRRLPRLAPYDGVLMSGLMSLTDLKALAPEPFPPTLVYFHENQLTYPLSESGIRDVAPAWTNVTTALAADRVVFNSNAHHDAFFEALPGLVRLMPDYRTGWVVEEIQRRSTVLYPGCRFPGAREKTAAPETGGPPLIVWNHRWEHDKNPEAFFRAMDRLAARGLEFRLALMGERFHRYPRVFRSVKERYGDRVVQYGFVPDRKAYFDWLRRGTAVVSTAIQENFGIAVVEAARCGCLPILPRRLSYPELVPEAYHDLCLYEGPDDLVAKLAKVLTDPSARDVAREDISRAMDRFSWDRLIHAYDRTLEETARRGAGGPAGPFTRPGSR